MVTWGLCGAAPNPLAERCHESICLPGATTATVQEMHLAALHMLCGAVDREVALRDAPSAMPARRRRFTPDREVRA
jgi:D-sedoheptulose 7-phosphate isomerase